MGNTLVTMFGLFIAMIGQFRYVLIDSPDWTEVLVFRQNGYEGKKYRNIESIKKWDKAMKCGHILTGLGFIVQLIGLIPF